jgi:putative transposase
LGWRRAAVEAKKAGWTVNHKRIHRLWIAEGLRVPYRKKKRPLRGIGRLVGPMWSIRPNVVWASTSTSTSPDLRPLRPRPRDHR